MKKDEQEEKTIEAILTTVKTELPNLVREEFKSIIWGEICKEVEEIEEMLDITISGYGFVPLAPRLRRIQHEIRSRKRQL